ncbi:MAG: ABC transporter permease [Actinobacteria bacterium]|nr:ABC transporter permease [Actinomycetota bacterium]
MPSATIKIEAREKARQSGVMARRVQAYSILVAWAVLILVFTLLLPDTFLTVQNFTAIANSKTATVLLTLGLIFALAAGEFDLSIGAALSLGAAIPAWLYDVYGTPVLIGILVALMAAALMGTLNALLSVRYSIPSLVVTLGTGTAVIGLVAGIVGNSTISIRGDWWNVVLTHRTFGLYTSFWIVMLIALIIWYILQQTPIGRHLYFVGQGREVARLAGIRVNAYRYAALITSATLGCLAGAFLLGNTGAIQARIGQFFILAAFAAAFLGSTAIVPGRFNAWGTVVAVYFIETGITGLQLLGLQAWVSDVFYGTALVVGVLVATLATRLRSRLSARST